VVATEPGSALLGDPDGLQLRVLALGAVVQRLWVPEASGRRVNVVLGSRDLSAYTCEPPDYFGAVIGRVANRISGGVLQIGGTPYRLAVNEGDSTLHGGPAGFHTRTWDIVDVGDLHVSLELVSPDGDQGFPGTLTVRVTYRVTDREVIVDYRATTDATTPVNLTQHSHVNLAGAGTVAGHRLQVAASRFTPVDEHRLPLGEHLDVAGSRWDLRSPTPLSGVLAAGGLDHNFVLDGPPVSPAAVLSDPASGRVLEVFTDRPGLQVYTGNAFHSLYPPYAGIALETQAFPDSPAHEGEPDWPSILLEPGQVWRSRTTWRFSAGPA
jgi:aldose 1-epimerase